METTEEMMKAFQSFYSQVNCSDLSLSIQAPDCTHLKGGGRNDGNDGGVKLDWRADPFLSMSDLTLVVFDGRTDGGGGISYFAHTLVLAYGGRKSGFIADQIKSQQRQRKKTAKTTTKDTNSCHVKIQVLFSHLIAKVRKGALCAPLLTFAI